MKHINRLVMITLIMLSPLVVYAQGESLDGSSVTTAETAEPAKELWHVVYFDTASWLMKAEAEATIKSIAEYLAANPKVSVIVSGHTDTVGGYKYNMNLSLKRATTVQQAIATLGVDMDRILIEYHGYTKPAVPGAKTAYQLAKNRRVVIYKVTQPEPPVEIPDDLQDYLITYGENDKFDVIITYECEDFDTFYGDWKSKCKVVKKGAEEPAVEQLKAGKPEGTETTAPPGQAPPVAQ